MPRNLFFAHPKNVLLSMLGNGNYKVQSVVIDKIQNLCGIVRSMSHSITTVQKKNKEEQAEDKNDSFGTISKSYIRQFLILQVDFNAISYHDMVDINSSHVSEPPLLNLLSDE